MVSNNVFLGAPSTPAQPTSPTSIGSEIIQRGGEQAQKNVVPAFDDPTLATPEKVNNLAETTQQAVNATAASLQAEQDAKRGAAVQIGSTQNQQAVIDAYVTSATGESSDLSSSNNLQTIADITQQRNEQNSLFNNRDTDSNLNRIQNSQASSLERKFDEAVGTQPSTNSFDVRV